jgi:hypothetical protein
MDPEQIITKGKRMLDRHRANYTATHPEPKYLQTLWWEFPPEHLPTPEIHPIADMTPDQTNAAIQFVDKLIDLGDLKPEEPDDPVLTNA